MIDPMDSDIDKAEKVLSSMSISDANVRLMYNTARLTDNVTSLAHTVSNLTASVSNLTQDVNGVQGVRGELKDIRRDQQDQSQEIANLKVVFGDARKLLWRVIWFLTVTGFITVVSDIRLVAPFLIDESHLTK